MEEAEGGVKSFNKMQTYKDDAAKDTLSTIYKVFRGADFVSLLWRD